MNTARPRPEIVADGIKLGTDIHPLLSGEIHYWRFDPTLWRRALEMLKLCGCNAVATYVPWDQHEIHEGYTSLNAALTYDFTGRTTPANNLVGFLELARDLGLMVLIRPGPVIIAEWRHKGPPLHAFAYDWPDERFTSSLRRWYAAVGEVIVRYSWQHGGPIVACQPDNEGHELTVEGFRLYLEQAFPDIAAFNARFGTDFADAAGAAAALCQEAPHNVLQQYVRRLATDNEDLQRLMRHAKEWFHAQYLEAVHLELRSTGVDLPFVINVIGAPQSTDFHRLHAHHDTLGMDNYPLENLPGGAWYRTEHIANYFSHVARYPYMAEFGSSSFLRAWCLRNGPVTPRHLQRLGLLYWALGLRGYNYYMFMDRDQCFHSPLDAEGRPTEGYYELYHLHRVLRRAGFPASRKRERVGLLWVMDWTLGHTEFSRDLDWIEQRRYARPDFDHPAFTRVFQALVDADAAFATLDCRHLDKYDLDKYGCLLLPAGPDLPETCRAAIEALPPAVRAKLRVVGDAPGFALDGVETFAIGELLRSRPACFFPAGEMPGAPLRTFVHDSDLGEILFVFNRSEQAQQMPVPETSRGHLVDLWHAVSRPLDAVDRLDIPAAGQAVFILTDTPDRVIGGELVRVQYE